MAEFISPVYGVKPVPIDNIVANNFNPNVQDDDVMELLRVSIAEDGLTQPIVVYLRDDGKYEIVDGYHRFVTVKNNKDLYDREEGCMPCVILDSDADSRKASTIRHNQARGTHDAELMVEIVKKISKSGMGDAWIMKNLGMDKSELVRLKQLTGLTSLFSDEDTGGGFIKIDRLQDHPVEEMNKLSMNIKNAAEDLEEHNEDEEYDPDEDDAVLEKKYDDEYNEE